MHAGARRCRGRADVNAPGGSRIGHRAQGGPQEELQAVVGAAGYIAPDVVLVVVFKIRRRHYVSGKHSLDEAGSEALDLSLDAPGHVYAGAAGDVAVGPDGVLSLR